MNEKIWKKICREEKEMIIRQLEVVTDHDFSDFFTIQLDSYIFLDQNCIILEPKLNLRSFTVPIYMW